MFSHDFIVNATALDISMEALDILAKQFPNMELVNDDLAKIAPNRFLESYDLVFSCYCLHHLVNHDDFVNALRFVGNSVKKEGFLLIMDPIIKMPYSKYDTLDFNSFRGNGIPRHLYLIDDILGKVGLQRRLIRPAVSFILNENIEAPGPIAYFLMTATWKVLCKFYRSEKFVQIFGGTLKYADKMLKHLSLSFSSSICLYQKT
jgi:SAM-dependent methyltransferase